MFGHRIDFNSLKHSLIWNVTADREDRRRIQHRAQNLWFWFECTLRWVIERQNSIKANVYAISSFCSPNKELLCTVIYIYSTQWLSQINTNDVHVWVWAPCVCCGTQWMHSWFVHIYWSLKIKNSCRIWILAMKMCTPLHSSYTVMCRVFVVFVVQPQKNKYLLFSCCNNSNDNNNNNMYASIIGTDNNSLVFLSPSFSLSRRHSSSIRWSDEFMRKYFCWDSFIQNFFENLSQKVAKKPIALQVFLS